MSDVFTKLAAPFAPGDIHWRAQTLAGNGSSALALAYIDARNVMARLDEVMGPANWRDSYCETTKGRLLCTLELRIDGEWIGKSDGAGNTDVEGDKGAISDALKRAAVKWGVGRYLYDLPATWADCESYEKNGKKHWKAWTQSGLNKLSRVAVIGDADAEVIEISALAQAAGVAIGAICDTYKVSNLNELSAEQRAAAKKRLNLTIDANAARKEAA